MTPDRDAQVRKLLDEAGLLPPGERARFLRRACGADESLLAAVEGLLASASQRETVSFTAGTAPSGLATLPETDHRVSPPGRRLGPYQLQRKLGAGGMGDVYLAVRVDDYHQQVAVKLLKSGLPTDDLLQRFRTERQVLAGLAHPHIARLLDGGTTEDGLPYLVMEYVDGLPIDRYCAERQLPVRERVRLLGAVCEAVAYAHGRTVVHRDLKPGNVLVTAGGEPRVLDFGLAKRLAPDPESGEGSGQTHTGVILGTPSYMAPEQAGGKSGEAGPAADVWALGAILYELLTGRPPFRADTSLDTVMQVLNEEPVPPSRLHPKLPRDVETICLKCLQKEPRRRYAGAAELADDLRRFHSGEPIQARPVGRLERLHRWARRRPAIAGLLAALALVLIVGFTVVTRLWLLAEERGAEAMRERDRAEKNFNRVLAAVEESLIQISRNKELKADEMLPFRRKLLTGAVRQFQQLTEEIGDNPRAREALARAHLRLGEIHELQGNAADAVRELQTGIDLYRKLLEADSRSRLYRSQLALAYEHLGVTQPDRAAAARALARSLELREELLAMDPARAAAYRSQLALNYFNIAEQLGRRDPQEALRWADRARAIREEQVRGGAGPEILGLLAHAYLLTGSIQSQLGRHKEGLASCQRGVDIYVKLAEANAAGSSFQLALADAYQELHFRQVAAGRQKDAAASLEQARAVLERLVAREVPPETNILASQRALARVYNNLALTYMEDFAQRAKAMRLFQQGRELCEKLLAVRPSDVELLAYRGAACYNLGLREYFNPDALFRLHQQARESLERIARLRPADLVNRRELSQVLNSLGTLLVNRGERAAGADLIRQGLEHQRVAFRDGGQKPDDREVLGQRCQYLARVRCDLKEPAPAAEAILERAALYPKNGAVLFQAACDLARCAALVAEGNTSLPPDRQAEYRRLTGLALDHLRAAVTAGFRDATRLRSEPSLEVLRASPDFQALLRAAEANTNKRRP